MIYVICMVAVRGVVSVISMVSMVGVSLRLMIFTTMHIVSWRVSLVRVRGMVLALVLSLILLPHWESSSFVISGIGRAPGAGEWLQGAVSA